MPLSGLEFFKIYTPLRLHFFTTRYDLFKYKGHTTIADEKIILRQDYTRFEMYGKKMKNRETAAHWCIANFLDDNKEFIYNEFKDSERTYTEWKMIKESLGKILKDDVTYMKYMLLDHDLELNEAFIPTKSKRPAPIIQAIMNKRIRLESAVLINRAINFVDTNKNMCHNDPYMQRVLFLIERYDKFVSSKPDVTTTLKEQGFNVCQ